MCEAAGEQVELLVQLRVLRDEQRDEVDGLGYRVPVLVDREPRAEALWLELLGKVKQPLQHDYVELALAWNYEFSQRLDKVFAADSPIKTPQLRYRLQRLAADLPLLRQQVTQGVDASERDSALFVLLYKELSRGQYAAFAEDFKRMPASPSPDKLGAGIGYFYDSGKPLTMFNWSGEPGESGYACPSIAEIAAVLQADSKQPRGLNCLGEFILRNDLDHSPLDAAPPSCPHSALRCWRR